MQVENLNHEKRKDNEKKKKSKGLLRLKRVLVGGVQLIESLLLHLATISLSVYITLFVMLEIPFYSVGTFFPSTPKGLGTSLAIDMANVEEHPLVDSEYDRSSIKYSEKEDNGELFEMFFVQSEDENNYKKVLIEGLFPYNSKETIDKFDDLFNVIPVDLLELMQKDGLEIMIAEKEPIPKMNGFLTGVYSREENEIVIYNSNYAPTTLAHELGHWLECYLTRNVDFYLLGRIGDDLREEVRRLGLNEFNEEYILTDRAEIFAAFFEVYLYDYDRIKTNAPIGFSFLTYYLEQLLMK